jgi:predicted regulator of Ras-like GTPase activity (Roadblock/LC7/MglB family)
MLGILKELRVESSGVEAAVLISSDAMPLASDPSDSEQEEVISATAFALITAGERVARDLARGDVNQLYLRGDAGDLVVAKVNEHAVLACMVDHQAKMGITLLEVGRCAQKLAEII